jgi:hypothetical protein
MSDDTSKKDAERRQEAYDEAKKNGMIQPDEDVNSNLEKAMDMAGDMFMKQRGLAPMIDIVLMSNKREMTRAGMMFAGIDFSDKKEKLRAMAAAGVKLAIELKDEEIVPVQVTLMSEAWQRQAQAKNEKELDEIDIEELDKLEVLICATQSWDGRTGARTKRIVRDVDEKPIGLVHAVEEWAHEDDREHEMDSILLKLFFLAFAAKSGQYSSSEDMRKRAKLQLDQLERALS